VGFIFFKSQSRCSLQALIQNTHFFRIQKELPLVVLFYSKKWRFKIRGFLLPSGLKKEHLTNLDFRTSKFQIININMK
jgi:hypothetical protein